MKCGWWCLLIAKQVDIQVAEGRKVQRSKVVRGGMHLCCCKVVLHVGNPSMITAVGSLRLAGCEEVKNLIVRCC